MSPHEDAAGRANKPEPTPLVAPLGSLREFVLANFSLLGMIGGLLGLVTFVAAWPLYTGWVRPYVTFLLLAAAVLLWLELLAQWPAGFTGHRRLARPGGWLDSPTPCS